MLSVAGAGSGHSLENQSLLNCLVLQKQRILWHPVIFRIKFFLHSKSPESLLFLADQDVAG